MDTVYKLGTVMTLKEAVLSPFQKIAANAEKIKGKFKEIDGGIQKFESSMKSLKIGGLMMAAGAGLAYFTNSLLNAGRETSYLKSSIGSLGLEKRHIDSLTISGIEAASKWRVTGDEFIDAAYDIKSGIETIKNSDIGSFTESVAKTATATKGSTKQMATLFGTIYNQNKKLYDGLSDADFGKLIGNSLSFAVQMYKTEGSKMQQAIESVSGAAAVAGYDISEQFNVLGMLQNVMQPGEAGTAFRAFVDKAAAGGKKLGLSFVGANGKILPVVDIIDKLKGKFGETIEASEAMDMKKAFGSDEAMKLINNLWDKSGKLKENIDALRSAEGTKFLDDMALKMVDNIDTKLMNLKNTWTNFKSTMGQGVGEALGPFVDLMKKGLALVTKFAASHPTLTKWIGGLLALGSVVLMVGGSIMTLRAISALYTLSQIAAGKATGISTLALIRQKGVAIASAVANKILAAAQWILNTAFWACPIVWIIGILIALGVAIYAIVKNWDVIKEKLSAVWEWIKGIFNKAVGWIKAKWNSITGFFSGIWSKLKNAGSRIITTIWEGIKEKARWIKDKVTGIFKSIGKLFPHSDAEEGPFSKLSFSGKAFIQTFNSGIEEEGRKAPAVTPYLKKTMSVLTGADTSQGIGPVSPGSPGGLTINVASLIGTLMLSGQKKEGRISELARAMAQAIYGEIARYGDA